MALKHLDLNEMVGLTSAWVDEHRPLLEGIPELAGWLPRIDAVHARVVKARPFRTVELDAKVAALVAQEMQLDARHDRLVRCVSRVLEAEQDRWLAADPPDPERAALCERALVALLPDGLSVVNTGYLAESGHALRVRHLLESRPWVRELLESIPMARGGTLLTVVESWCSVGEQLGHLEGQKSSVLSTIDNLPRPARPEMLAARTEWLKVVKLVLDTLELVTGHDLAVEKLRGPIVRIAEHEGKRHAAKSKRAHAPGSGPSPAGGEGSGPGALPGGSGGARRR